MRSTVIPAFRPKGKRTGYVPSLGGGMCTVHFPGQSRQLLMGGTPGPRAGSAKSGRRASESRSTA